MKKIISLILSMAMVLSSLCITGFAAESESNEVTVYVTVSKYGEIVTDKNNCPVAMTPIELSGAQAYSLDDVFRALHTNLYEEDISGYETATGDYGLYVIKFWGDTSENFTYQVNFGEADVWGPTHEIENGDYIEFCINKSLYPNTEVYTRFDKTSVETQPGESVDFVLLQGEYTADGLSFTPCTDAIITINGIATENTTNEEGLASVSFDEYGNYVVSAVKTKLVNDETVTAIEAPVCVVTVTDTPETDIPSDAPTDDLEDNSTYITAEEQMHSIVRKYLADSLINDGNMCWFVADFADYLKIYPDSQYVLTSTQKQNCADKIIAMADSSTSQGDLAKSIIALRALGYDARNTYTKKGAALDIVSRLNSLITEESTAAPYYEFTLPYVLIALGQGEDYDNQNKTDLLINAAIASKSSWQDTTWGIDGAAPMLRALAPYSNTNPDVEALINETTQMIKDYQGNDGSMGNAASTGLAIAGLCAAEINPETVLKNEKNLIDGLMSQSNETFDGFLPGDNSFSSEQGLRGLVAWKLCDSGKMIYDFKDFPKNEARATPEIVSTPVYSGGGISTKPEAEEKENVKEPEIVEEKPQGLSGKNEDVKILPVIFEEKTFEDIQNHESLKAIEELAIRGIINGKTEKTYCPDETMTRAEFASLVVKALGLPIKNTDKFDDVTDADWFNSYVNTAFSYGIINGVSENRFNPNEKITREELATMLLRAAKLCGKDEEANEDSVRNTLAQFSDYIQASGWAKTALAFCYSNEIFDSTVIEIEPKTQTTRAEVAQALYNMLGRVKLI